MPLYTSVVRVDEDGYWFRADEWDAKARSREPVGVCPTCGTYLYGEPAYQVDFGGATYREMECQRGHVFVAPGKKYRTAPIADPASAATRKLPGEL